MMNTCPDPVPWRFMPKVLTLVAVLVALVLMVMTLQGRKSEQETMARILMAQGESLIKAAEAGRRMGHMNRGAHAFRVAGLMDEMMDQGALLFWAIINTEGQVEAMSESQLSKSIDLQMLTSLEASPDIAWALAPSDAEQIFLVYRTSRPPQHPMHRHGPMRAMRPEAPVTLVVGLDASVYVHATHKDILALAMASGLGLTLIFAGWASIFWRRKVAALEQEIRKQEHLAALGTLAAGVAHEIRNPLSSIKGFATYFLEKFDPNSKDRELAQVMIGETERLNRVVSDLLALTHPSDLHREKRSIKELAVHALQLVAADCQSQKITIDHSGLKDVMVSMDFDRLLQGLLNILLNAVQAMPQGGALELSTTLHKESVSLHIRDRGLGMTPEDVTRIFDPYFTTKSQGTGLGLPIVRRIVEAHGGQIMVQSIINTGTQVTITLPLKE